MKVKNKLEINLQEELDITDLSIEYINELEDAIIENLMTNEGLSKDEAIRVVTKMKVQLYADVVVAVEFESEEK